MSGAFTAFGLRDAGCTVAVHAAAGGRGGHRGRGISWSLGPPAGSIEYLESVTAAITRERPDVVYPVTEPIQWRIEDAAPQWSSLLPPWLRDPSRAARDKRWVSALVAAAGVAVPDERDIGVASSDAELGALGMPVVVKGIRGRGGNATRIVASCDEARSAVKALAGRGIPAFLQRHVRGATYLAGGVFDAGTPLRWYAGVKRVQFPARTGPAAVIESVHDAALDDAARRAIAATGVSGLASADFIRDSDGRYLFLELNPRPWGSLTAAADAGVDMFRPLTALLAGSTPLADLAFRHGVSSSIVPLCLLSRACWRAGIAHRAMLRAMRGAALRDPGELIHLAARLVRVGANWR